MVERSFYFINSCVLFDIFNGKNWERIMKEVISWRLYFSSFQRYIALVYEQQISKLRRCAINWTGVVISLVSCYKFLVLLEQLKLLCRVMFDFTFLVFDETKILIRNIQTLCQTYTCSKTFAQSCKVFSVTDKF